MLTSKVVIFVAELLGTFGLVVAATGSIVYDSNAFLGIGFVSAIHFIGLAILVFVFGRYSMAHFNPAVTLGFWLTRHIPLKSVPVYVAAQFVGAVGGSLFVKITLGDFANLGLNFPNPSYHVFTYFGIEVLATLFLMGGILLLVGIKRVPLPIVSVVVGGIVALDVFYFGSISGASMNPIRSLAPALVTAMYDDLWLYWTAPFLGSFLAAVTYKTLKSRTSLH